MVWTHGLRPPHTGRQVATVGRIEAVPGAPNVVPGEVRATLEIRDLEMAKIGRVFAEIEARARTIEADREVTVALEQFYESLAAPTCCSGRSSSWTGSDQRGSDTSMITR